MKCEKCKNWQLAAKLKKKKKNRKKTVNSLFRKKVSKKKQKSEGTIGHNLFGIV